MSDFKLAVTVTLDGRVLIQRGRNVIELVTPGDVQDAIAALQEAQQVQDQVVGAAVWT